MNSQVAELLRRARTTGFLVGAGISVSAGYPDFRSKDGIYSRIAHMNLPYPEAIFDIRHFRHKPQDFFTAATFLARDDRSPTATHRFIRTLQDKGLLEVVVTQNIDGLERKAGVQPEKLVEVHGSSATSQCIDCGAEFDNAEMRRLLRVGEVAKCKECGGLAKPSVVFFGEPVKMDKYRVRQQIAKCDMFFIIGTSLKVQPAGSLSAYTRADAVRVLINKELPESFEVRPLDHVLHDDCDKVCSALAASQGWML